MKKDTAHRAPRRRIPDGTLNIAAAVVFAAAVFIMLVSSCGIYMRRVEALSLFIGTSTMWERCMAEPGGLVSWLSLYLTQYMYVPWLGALVYTVLLALLWVVFARAVRLPKPWFAASAILPASVVLAFTNLGYLIFTLKPVGYAFALPIGLLMALLIFWGYRKSKSWLLSTLFVVLIVLVGYPLLGCYALLCAVMCALYSAVSGIRCRTLANSVPAVMAAAAVCIVPRAYFLYIGGDVLLSRIYLSPLPRFYSYETGYRLLYAAIFAVCILGAAILPQLRPDKINVRRASRLSAVLCIAVIILMPLLRYKDANFYHTLAMDAALWDQDYDKAVQLSADFDDTPTRLNSVLAHIALMRGGQAGDRMFAIGYGWEPYSTTRAARAFHDAEGALISYHLGMANYAYRWCTENMIGQGLSAERLKLMAKCALLNYEPKLAKTYIDLLYNTTYHREWARRYRKYLSDPLLISTDAELMAVKRMMCYPNEFINDKGEFEGYVWPLIANAPTGTPDFNELRMQAALLTRDLDSFMPALEIYAYSGRRIPRHYQEAALLWSMLTKSPCPIPIDPVIEASHNEFLRMFRATSRYGAEEQRELMRDGFSDTYWFYHVFCDNMELH